ncbi:hypothetical protein [Rhizobium sp. Root1204]|uniref:hypothetical protein n=1 Tax=Rhizobium sp. Root1204 TaxID=1736428 RepID=UPI0012E397D9|nr:hypothetical protein [Rhizobium sp. Root1204]
MLGKVFEFHGIRRQSSGLECSYQLYLATPHPAIHLRVDQADVDKGIWKDVAAGVVPTDYQRFADAVASGISGDPDFRHAAAFKRSLILPSSAAKNGGKWRFEPRLRLSAARAGNNIRRGRVS